MPGYSPPAGKTVWQSGKRRGNPTPDPAEHAFQPTLESFVREAIQNEIERRKRAALRASLRKPHPESEELAELADQDVDPADLDLHRPTVDDLTITRDGTTYTRVPDVFDVWLDSSVASWGTLDYPEEEEAFEELWPADLIMEAHDQTRGWFWSQLGMGTAALDEIEAAHTAVGGEGRGAGMPRSRSITPTRCSSPRSSKGSVETSTRKQSTFSKRAQATPGRVTSSGC